LTVIDPEKVRQLVYVLVDDWSRWGCRPAVSCSHLSTAHTHSTQSALYGLIGIRGQTEADQQTFAHIA
jgi:hypothetical protein